MYIVKKKNTIIIVQKNRNNNSINVINSISNELEVDTCEAEEFVSIFCTKYVSKSLRL